MNRSGIQSVLSSIYSRDMAQDITYQLLLLQQGPKAVSITL